MTCQDKDLPEKTFTTEHPLSDTYGVPSSVVSRGNTEQNIMFLPIRAGGAEWWR